MKDSRTKISSLVAEQSLKKGVSRSFDRKLAAYLVQEGRVKELNSIMRDVQADWAEAGHLEVMAASAYPLSPTVKKDIQKRMKKLYPSAKTIVISEVHDESVVGGVALGLPGQQLDLSVEAKLNKFKQLTTEGKD